MGEKRVLPADVWDTLELTALVFGGIGADFLSEESRRARGSLSYITDTPFCILGHAGFASGDDDRDLTAFWCNPITRALQATLGGDDPADVNNRIVRRINGRNDRELIARVSWEEYTRELGIARGD